MKEFVTWLFSQNNSDLQVGLFNFWYFFYLFIMFGSCFVVHCAYYAIRHFAKRKLLSSKTNTTARLSLPWYFYTFSILEYQNTPPKINIPPRICTGFGISQNSGMATSAATTGSHSLEADTNAGE